MVYPQRDDEQRYGEESPARRIDRVDQGQLPKDQQVLIVQTPEEHVDQPDGRMDTAKPPASSRREENPVSLVPPDVVTEFRAKWNSIQIKFVDEPRGAVKEADTLVADMIRRITELFANERSGLEQQWTRGDNVSTEDLRIAMQRYRSFFDRLLSH
jgi:hypothetical protein